MRLRRLFFGTVSVFVMGMVACVGDAPSDGSSGGDASTTGDGGNSGNDATTNDGSTTPPSDGGDASVLATGKFDWALHFTTSSAYNSGGLVDDTVTSNDIAFDSAGNAIVVIDYAQSTTIGGMFVSTSVQGNDNILVAKISPTGTVLWAKGYGGNKQSVVRGVAVSSTGDVFVTGWGTDNPQVFTSTANDNPGGVQLAFVAKLSGADGTQITSWQPGIAFGAGSMCTDVAIGPGDRIAVGCATGQTGATSTTDVDGGTTNLTYAGGTYDGVVFLLDPASGKTIWSSSIGSSNMDKVLGVHFDSEGDVIAVGEYHATVSTTTPALTYTGSGGSGNGFVVKLRAADGTTAFAKGYGTGVSTNDVTVDSSDNIVVTGFFSLTADFGSGFVMANAGASGNDAFVMKLDSSGAPVWDKEISGDQLDYGTGVAVDALGNVVALGSTSSPSLTIDNVATTLSLTATTDPNVYALKWDKNGNLLWGKTVLTSAGDFWPARVATSPTGSIGVVGTFAGTVDLGDGNVIDGDPPDSSNDNSGMVLHWEP